MCELRAQHRGGAGGGVGGKVVRGLQHLDRKKGDVKRAHLLQGCHTQPPHLTPVRWWCWNVLLVSPDMEEFGWRMRKFESENPERTFSFSLFLPRKQISLFDSLSF